MVIHSSKLKGNSRTMSKKKVALAEVEQEDVEVITAAGALYYKTFASLIEENTHAWPALAEAMDAALVIKSKSPEYADEADLIILGAATSLTKDMQTIFTMFREDLGMEFSEEPSKKYNFVPV